MLLLCYMQVVAVKQLDRNGFQGNREFLVEVLILSLLHHPNLVNLVGYCAEGEQRILVYEYMPNGSLEDHLLGKYMYFLLAHCPCPAMHNSSKSRIASKLSIQCIDLTKNKQQFDHMRTTDHHGG